MNSKILLSLLALLAVCSIVSADVGPSPSFSFSVNQDFVLDGYKLYYAGNIWPDRLEEVTENTSVYKLNTNITIYAVPENTQIENFEEAVSKSFKSQEFSLKSGHTLFTVVEFNEPMKTMGLVEESNEPDETFGTGSLLLEPVVWVAVIGAIVLLAVFFKRKRKA